MAGLVLISGCGTSYEGRIDSIVDAACDAVVECDRIGDLFESETECRSDVDSLARTLSRPM
ncbi:MAG: hypothetical protein AAFU77_10925 [Myxococcota bacterium]